MTGTRRRKESTRTREPGDYCRTYTGSWGPDSIAIGLLAPRGRRAKTAFRGRGGSHHPRTPIPLMRFPVPSSDRPIGSGDAGVQVNRVSSLHQRDQGMAEGRHHRRQTQRCPISRQSPAPWRSRSSADERGRLGRPRAWPALGGRDEAECLGSHPRAKRNSLGQTRWCRSYLGLD
jgi:hypothetical protein